MPLMISWCACESGKSYHDCCKPAHSGLAPATAEALMRSRYVAFTLSLEDYLLKTWHPDTRPTALHLAEDTQKKWLGLSIKHAENINENAAIVEFIARYKVAGKATRLHETSQFERIDGAWYYVSGTFNT